jgi:hypothetical protein
MRTLIAVILFVVLCACSSTNGGNTQSTSEPTGLQSQTAATSVTMTLRNSTVSFSQAQAACVGTLGSVSFSLNHIRAHPSTGVDLQEKTTATNGVMTIVFSAKASGKTATVEVNSHTRSVSGKNVIVKLNKSVACVGAE